MNGRRIFSTCRRQKKMQTETRTKQNARKIKWNETKRNDNEIQLNKFANKSVTQKCKIQIEPRVMKPTNENKNKNSVEPKLERYGLRKIKK